MSPKNSKKSSKKLPLFSCPNPDCPVRYRSFDTIKGYQNHLTHYPVCTAYAYTRHPFLTAIDGKHTQPIATATVPTVAFAQESLNDSWNSSTLLSGNARVTQHARLNPEYPHGSIPNYQDFAIFGDIEEAEPSPEAATMPSGPDAAEPTEARKLPSADPIPQWHSLEDRAIWKLLVILDSMECPDYAFEAIMQWASEFHQAGYDFAPKAKNRHSNITKFYHMIQGSHLMLPIVSQVPCDHYHDLSMEVIGFDFVTQMQTFLLTDKSKT